MCRADVFIIRFDAANLVIVASANIANRGEAKIWAPRQIEGGPRHERIVSCQLGCRTNFGVIFRKGSVADIEQIIL